MRCDYTGASREPYHRRHGLSPATVTGITGTFRDAGYLVESGIMQPAIGWPSQMLSLSPDGARAIGIKISADVLDAVALNLRRDVVVTHIEAWGTRSPEQAVDAIERAVTAASRRLGESDHILGVGVAVSDIVDHNFGVVIHSGALTWEDVPSREILSDRLGVPVEVDDYVNAFALGRLLFGERLSPRELLIVNAVRASVCPSATSTGVRTQSRRTGAHARRSFG